MKKFLTALICVLLLALPLTALAASTANVSVLVSSGGTAKVECGGAMLTATGSFQISYETSYDLTVTATPQTGYKIASISCGATTYYNSPATFTGLTGDANVSIQFAETVLNNYSVTVNAAANGTVNTSGGSYTEGSAINIAATPNAGYVFAGWTSSNGGSFADANAANTTFTVPASNTVVTANFKSAVSGDVHTLTVVAATAGGTVCIADRYYDLTNITTGSYKAGDVIRLRTTRNSGYRFLEWEADAGQIGSMWWYDTDFTMPDCDVTVYAHFVNESTGEVEELNTSPTTPGTPGNDTPVSGEPGNVEIAPEYNVETEATEGGTVALSMTAAKEGETIVIRATPHENYSFSYWTSTAGGVFADENAAYTTFTVPANDTVLVAVFEPSQGSATVEVEEKGGFPWLLIGIGAAVAALLIGGATMFFDRKNRVFYDTEKEYADEYDRVDRRAQKKQARAEKRRRKREAREAEYDDFDDFDDDDF